jgi:nitrate/nitrite-specific signal transduction histidine kinase
MNQFEKMTTIELDTLAVKTAKRVDHLQFHARDTYANRKELARLQERLAKMDVELNKR